MSGTTKSGDPGGPTSTTTAATADALTVVGAPFDSLLSLSSRQDDQLPPALLSEPVDVMGDADAIKSKW